MKKSEVVSLLFLLAELGGALAFAALGHVQIAGTLVAIAIAHAAPSALPGRTPPAETPHDPEGGGL